MGSRLGLALGGGGARGLAHLGVLIALTEAEIPISVIAGTSMGAAMGAVRAIGADLRKVEALLHCLDLNDLLQVTGSTMRELQKVIGRSMVEYVRGSSWRDGDGVPNDLARLNELYSLLTANKTFDEVVIPFVVVTADVETGRRVLLDRGKLYRAITASTAVPGIFSPVAHHGRLLIDGGVVDKLPADVTIDMGATAVIAVDTGAPADRPVDTCLDALLQAQRATSQQLTQLQLECAKQRLDGRLLTLRPKIGWIKMFEFEHTNAAIQAGIDAVEAHLDDIRSLLREVPVSGATRPAQTPH